MTQNCFTLFHCNSCLTFHPRTYPQTPAPPAGYRGWGGGGCPPPLGVFDLLQYFETILSLWKAFDLSQQDEVYFIGGGAAGGLITYNGRHLARHLGFLPRIKIIFCTLPQVAQAYYESPERHYTTLSTTVIGRCMKIILFLHN